MSDKTNGFSIIDSELTVDGNITTKGKLIIKGMVKGTLKGESVIISDKGSVFADTDVVSMTVGGNLQGNIRASGELIILSTGTCTGKITCRELVVEPGGILNAEVYSIKSRGFKQEGNEKNKKIS
ncbi:MAG: polymer-forming cytoskeletal protein [Deltaproteobacteria bacterium]|nr:polymer-forming cytoskeletal protein [Deltaproteobacteria bacterium]